MFSLLLGVDRSGAAGARESMYLTPGAAGLARLPHVTRRAQASTSSASSPCLVSVNFLLIATLAGMW